MALVESLGTLREAKVLGQGAGEDLGGGHVRPLEGEGARVSLPATFHRLPDILTSGVVAGFRSDYSACKPRDPPGRCPAAYPALVGWIDGGSLSTILLGGHAGTEKP